MYKRRHLPVESCHSLSAWGYFQRAQMWTKDEDESNFEFTFDDTRAVIRFTRNGHACEQTIELTKTPCNYGGARAWFVCPHCKRRVGKVYLPCTAYVLVEYGLRVEWFLCRHCYDLTYLQRRERSKFLTMECRADRIAARWLGEITEDFIYKRKGQHWRTFNKRFEQYERAIAAHNAAGWTKIAIFARRGWIDLG